MRNLIRNFFSRKLFVQKGVRKKGFTIIEFVIVIGMMAALAGMLTPLFYSSQEAARISRAKTEVDAIVSALRAYYADYGHLYSLPKTIPTVAIDADDLVDEGYLPKNENDPWGSPYVIVIDHLGDLIDSSTGRPKASTEVSVKSIGPDKTPAANFDSDPEDDIKIYVINIP